MIELIDFHQIEDIWKNFLWVGRQDVESHSAMKLNGGYDMENMSKQLWCYGVWSESNAQPQLIGVNSVHLCGDNSMRSRGLWVNPYFRQLGWGAALLQYGIDIAKKENCPYIWSYPRKTSWSVYKSVGFSLSSDWVSSDTSPENAFCKLDLT